MSEIIITDSPSMELNRKEQIDEQTNGDIHHTDSLYVVDYGNHTTITNACCSTCVCKGDDSTGCNIVNTILSNPTWGWILIVAIALFFVFRGRLAHMLDIHSKKIESSKVCSGKIGPSGYSYEQLEESDVNAFDQKVDVPREEASAKNPAEVPAKTPAEAPAKTPTEIPAETLAKTPEEPEYYYPAFEDILGNMTANKILSTLWRYQKDFGLGNNNAKRWSFSVNEDGFHNIARKLNWSGLIITNGSMYMLSNVGIRFCKKYEGRLNMENLYGPFVKG
jgi:hypothetical protein